jgi:secondary thiamine-phosphate synthase enzyme
MKQFQRLLSIQTAGQQLIDFTRQVQSVVKDSGFQTGLCHLFVRHTSASLVIQENADPDVLRDLAAYFAALVPEEGYQSLSGAGRFTDYAHDAEGPDDMPAHIRSALTHTSEQIPIVHGQLALGTWQGIYLWEHRAQRHSREVIVHLLGE